MSIEGVECKHAGSARRGVSAAWRLRGVAGSIALEGGRSASFRAVSWRRWQSYSDGVGVLARSGAAVGPRPPRRGDAAAARRCEPASAAIQRAVSLTRPKISAIKPLIRRLLTTSFSSTLLIDFSLGRPYNNFSFSGNKTKTFFFLVKRCGTSPQQPDVLLIEPNILLLEQNIFVIPIITNDFVGVTKPFFSAFKFFG